MPTEEANRAGATPVSPLAPHVSSAEELHMRLRAARSGEPHLVYRTPADRQVIVMLTGRTHVTIGRRAGCDVCLSHDARVSRVHAELVLIGSDWILTDDGLSSNGTWVGSQRIGGRFRLTHETLVRVGSTLIAFCDDRESQVRTVITDNPLEGVTISPAQRRVLLALCRPFLLDGSLSPPTNPQVAGELFLSVESVRTHLRALFEAFTLDDVEPRQKRSALVERAVRLGIVSGHDLAD